MRGVTCRGALVAGAAALLLAGCVSDFYATPRPFEGTHRNDQMIDSIIHGASVEIRPVAGLPAAEALALSDAISRAAHELDIAAVTGEGAKSADSLSGTAELVTGFTLPPLPPRLFVIGGNGRRAALPGAPAGPADLSIKQETELRLSWTLAAADGTVRDSAEIRQAIIGTRPELDKRERGEIAARTVAWLRGVLDREAASVPVAGPGSPAGKPIILVSPVEGASGDGRVSLTTAVAELLAASGLCEVLAASELTRIPKGRSAYRVKGHVRITDGSPGEQIVDIAWQVTDLVGREIGTVTQSNATPRGSLDGPWGATAYAAAEGARDGVLALIAQTEAPPPVE